MPQVGKTNRRFEGQWGEGTPGNNRWVMWGISSAPPSLRRHHTEITKAFATCLYTQSPRTQDILRRFRLTSALCPSTELVIAVPETKYVYEVRKGFAWKMKKKTYCHSAESRCMFYSILLPGPYTPPSFGTTFPHFNRIPLLLPPSATPFSCTTQPHKHST